MSKILLRPPPHNIEIGQPCTEDVNAMKTIANWVLGFGAAYIRDFKVCIFPTMLAGTGYYLQLVETDKRPGYSAAVYTEYVVMNASCLELFYHFTGNSNTLLEVVITTEDLQV